MTGHGGRTPDLDGDEDDGEFVPGNPTGITLLTECRIRRCNLPRRLPRRRPHRRRRHARHHGASTTPRRPLNRHLRLVPFRDGAGPALRLLDAGGAQGTESGQGGRAGSVQRDQLVQQPRSVRGGRDGDWVFQESGDWELG